MKQNKYNDPGFFANYSQMARSIGGLDAAGEWPAFRVLLPELRDKKVLIDAGFAITKLSEPQPTKDMLDKRPDMRDETRRPMFLLMAAVRNP